MQFTSFIFCLKQITVFHCQVCNVMKAVVSYLFLIFFFNFVIVSGGKVNLVATIIHFDQKQFFFIIFIEV